jgi:FkbM family methyltransferase
MLQFAPRGTHFAFEPVPRQYRYLVETFPKVKVHQVALSDSPGEATFVHVVSRPTYSGLRAIQYPSSQERTEVITVRTARLDDLIPPELPIHFVKVDVEGAEFQVFSGGVETLRKNRPVVVFEHGQAAAAVYGTVQEKLYDLLSQGCGLRVSLMSRWLKGEPHLSPGEFVEEVQSGRNFYYIAYP